MAAEIQMMVIVILVEVVVEHQQNVGILVWPGKLDNVCLRWPGQIWSCNKHNAIPAHLIWVQGLEYIVHFIVGLAYFYNKYVKSIWYYR